MTEPRDPTTDALAWRHAKAVALLPAMNVIVIPVILSAAFGARLPGPAGTPIDWLTTSVGVLLLAAGATAVVATIGSFVRRGRGTLAPWDPPRALVVDGPYRYCRNPMKAGLFLVLAGEAALLESPPILGWLLLFALANILYIRVSEEPALRRRFGLAYERYCERVPRWWPRASAAWAAAPGAEERS